MQFVNVLAELDSVLRDIVFQEKISVMVSLSDMDMNLHRIPTLPVTDAVLYQ